MKSFVSPTEPGGQAALDQWLRVTAQDLGPELARHRVPAASKPMVALLGCLALLLTGLLCAGVVAVAMGWMPFAAVAVPVVFSAIVSVPLLVWLLTQWDSQDIAVRRHGLVVGSRPVPFATMDPGRFMWATSARAGRCFVTLPRRCRTAGGDCVIINGTDGPDAVNDDDKLGSSRFDPHSWVSFRKMRSPFVWWVLGPRDVGAFIWDVEQAMVADGYPVGGLTHWLGAHRVTLPETMDLYPRRAPLDPPLWAS